MTDMSKAEVHILDNEAESKAVSNRPGQRQWYCIDREMCS